jgi:hypothetical protein
MNTSKAYFTIAIETSLFWHKTILNLNNQQLIIKSYDLEIAGHRLLQFLGYCSILNTMDGSTHLKRHNLPKERMR